MSERTWSILIAALLVFLLAWHIELGRRIRLLKATLKRLTGE